MGVDIESVAEATSGAVGALLSTTILYPLDTCKTRYQADDRASGRQKYRFTRFFPFPFRSYSVLFVPVMTYVDFLDRCYFQRDHDLVIAQVEVIELLFYYKIAAHLLVFCTKRSGLFLCRFTSIEFC